jgi:iron(III) transport system permease protein
MQNQAPPLSIYLGAWRRPTSHVPPLIFTIPALTVSVAMLAPLAYLLVRASGNPDTFQLMTSARTAQLLSQTIALAAAVTCASVLLGVPLAWLTTRSDLPWKRFWTVALVIPLVFPTYVGAFAYIAALGPRGLFQQTIAAPLGIERLPEIYGFGGAVFVLALFTYPYVVLNVRAAALGLDPQLEHVSRSLGDTPWQTFTRITIPLLRPSITAGALLVALYTLSDFGAVSILQYDSFTRAIYLQYQGSLDRHMAAVLALVLILLAGSVLALETLTRGRARYYRSASGATAEPSIVPLGRWRWPAIGLCSLVFATGVLIPAGVLVYWFARGVMAGTAFGAFWNGAVNSAYSSALSATVALLAAIPISVLIVRYPGRLASLVERITYSAFALPGIVVALALVFFGANYVPVLYQTLALLTCAYIVRFLPEAVGAVRSGLLQVSPRLEEAARALGHRPLYVLFTVTAPLLWPSALAGMALVFLSTMKELPVTLLLSPIGFRTLATASWNAATEGFFAQAALPSLLIVLVSAASLAFVMPEIRAGGEGDHG